MSDEEWAFCARLPDAAGAFPQSALAFWPSLTFEYLSKD
jgi:hypothetical protein